MYSNATWCFRKCRNYLLLNNILQTCLAEEQLLCNIFYANLEIKMVSSSYHSKADLSFSYCCTQSVMCCFAFYITPLLRCVCVYVVVLNLPLVQHFHISLTFFPLSQIHYHILRQKKIKIKL